MAAVERAVAMVVVVRAVAATVGAGKAVAKAVAEMAVARAAVARAHIWGSGCTTQSGLKHSACSTKALVATIYSILVPGCDRSCAPRPARCPGIWLASVSDSAAVPGHSTTGMDSH